MPDSHPRLARSAGVFGLATITSRILGLVRDQVLAFYFGAGDANDAFRVAFRVPNLVRDLFAEGAMSAAFVPTFTRQLTLQGRERAWHLASSVINALLIVTSLVVIAGVVFAEPLVRLFASEFAQVPGKFELTVQLTRIMFPFLTMVALAAALMGMLNSLGHFFVPALSPAMFNVGSIVIALVFIPLAPDLGLAPITVVAIGTLVGGLGQLVIQWPPLRREGFRYRAVLDFRDEGLRHVLLLMGPGTIGMAATQINVFVNTVLATGEGTGAVSWLDFAFRLMYLPIGLFGVSIATAATPAVSRMVAEADFGRIRSTMAGAIGLMLLLNVPASLGLIVLARPIVSVIFEHGSFTAADTAATAAALQLYAIGLVGYSIVRIVSPTFYALRRSRIPVMASAASVVINVALNLALVRVMGYRGLALGTSITALVNASLQLWLLKREIHGLEGGRILSTLVRVIVAAVAMAAAAWAANDVMTSVLPGQGLAIQIVRLAASIGGALATLAGMAQLLRIPEFTDARDLILGRLRRMAG
ncbi:MAG: murein biosynthesis integral membrane protein MurJ [Acidobacteria bacterium RIFCSPLOWO2_12_FULL_67_14b]|nr:MAG: murein biosynthesis integral membrane protein MurJ [Acidobacteria bacterium RIFCSPLOWO2_12_FULL_67_14b]